MTYPAGLMAALAEAVLQARELVVFSGAGISVDSGIPAFRDGATGLWSNVDPEKVASLRGFHQDPQAVWQWHSELKSTVDGKRPNAGHQAIAELEQVFPGRRFTVITQNIDGYHRQAGNSEVLDLHGSIHRLKCHADCGYLEDWSGSRRHAAACPRCGGELRPDVVWFGEALDSEIFGAAVLASFRADVFFAVGTSASVQPAAGLPLKARSSGAMVVEVNPHETPFTPSASVSVRADAGRFFGDLVALLKDRHAAGG